MENINKALNSLLMAALMAVISLPLWAQEGGGQQGAGGALGMFVPLIIMFVIFYFLLIRPNQKKEKERQKMINELTKGDKVITSGGIYGLVVGVKPEENKVVLKISDNTKVEFAKNAVTTKLQS